MKSATHNKCFRAIFFACLFAVLLQNPAWGNRETQGTSDYRHIYYNSDRSGYDESRYDDAGCGDPGCRQSGDPSTNDDGSDYVAYNNSEYTATGYDSSNDGPGRSQESAATSSTREGQVAVNLPVRPESVKVIQAVPDIELGAKLKNYETAFPSQTVNANQGQVRLEVGETPIYVVEYVLNPAANYIVSSPFGLHPAHTYKNHPRHRRPPPLPSQMGCDFSAARDLGIGWNRPEFYALWFFIQPTDAHLSQGRYEWAENDYVFGTNPNSIRILGNMGGIQERLAAMGGHGGSSYTFQDKKAEEAFVKFVTHTVERYDGDGKEDMPGLKSPIKYWQIDNEPAGRSSDWQAFARMFTLASGAVKSACPDCKVSMGGVMGEQDLRRFYKPVLQQLPKDSLDFFDFHFFDHGDDFYRLRPLYNSVRSLLDETGFQNVPIWATEIGTYSGEPLDRGRRLPFKSEWKQASDLVKFYTTLLALGVQKVFWAFGMVEGFAENTIFENTGLIYDGKYQHDQGYGQKKLAFYAYKKLIQMLSGCDFSKSKTLSINSQVKVLQFIFPKRNVYVLWRDLSSS